RVPAAVAPAVPHHARHRRRHFRPDAIPGNQHDGGRQVYHLLESAFAAASLARVSPFVNPAGSRIRFQAVEPHRSIMISAPAPKLCPDDFPSVRMKIVVVDGRTLAADDLSWDALRELGTVELHDRSTEAEVSARVRGAAVLIAKKAPVSAAVSDRAAK